MEAGSYARRHAVWAAWLNSNNASGQAESQKVRTDVAGCRRRCFRGGFATGGELGPFYTCDFSSRGLFRLATLLGRNPVAPRCAAEMWQQTPYTEDEMQQNTVTGSRGLPSSSPRAEKLSTGRWNRSPIATLCEKRATTLMTVWN